MVGITGVSEKHPDVLRAINSRFPELTAPLIEAFTGQRSVVCESLEDTLTGHFVVLDDLYARVLQIRNAQPSVVTRSWTTSGTSLTLLGCSTISATTPLFWLS